MSMHDVIIIGSGISALASARVLKHYKPLLLEANPDRIGGRALTMFVGGDERHPVDLGCSMIHGYNEGNPLKRVFRELGLPSPHIVKGSKTVVVGRNGPLSETDSADLLTRASEAAYKPDPTQAKPSADTSVAEVTFKTNLSRDVKALVRMAEIGAGDSLEQFSAHWWGFARPYGGTDAFPVGGYKSLIDALADEVQRAGGRLEMDKRVTGISHSNNPGHVEVAADGQTYNAKYVISTIPLACLQDSETAPSFTPELPKSTREAIERTNVGLLDKVVLSYEQSWWPSPDLNGQFIILPDDQEPANVSKSVNTGTLNVSSFAKIGYQAHSTLLVYLDHSLARSYSNVSDDVLIDQVHRRLAAKLGSGRQVPPPNREHSAVSHWRSDKLSKGATSTPVSLNKVNGVAASPLDFVELSRSHWDGRLGFAGEHTSLDHRGSAAGAWESGAREGRRVLDLLDNATEAKL
ncbi:hypothetical protein ACM66B_002540 [Microbotryomycetes sp. NB124-2]